MQLTSRTDRGRDELASDGPNYPIDLSSRLRAEGGEKEECEQLSM